MRPLHVVLRLGTVKAERWRLVLGLGRLQNPGFALLSAARPSGGSASKARLFQALQAKTKCPLSALTVPSRNTTCSGRTGTILSD